MKMTIITDDQGNILGAVQGDSLSEKKGDVEAGVSFAEGFQTHLVDVDDDLATMNSRSACNTTCSSICRRSTASSNPEPRLWRDAGVTTGAGPCIGSGPGLSCGF